MTYRILLVGHACGPKLGSEPGLTWNWAWQLSRFHRVFVLTHPQYRDAIEAYLDENHNPNLKFHWLDVPAAIETWHPDAGERGIRPHYLLWRHLALRRALALHEKYHFDLAHHVSWNTIGAPPVLWKLPIPFLSGPVAGGVRVPAGFGGYCDLGEKLRGVRVGAMPWTPTLRRAVRRSAMVFAANRETADLLRRAGARNVVMFSDNGTPEDLLIEKPVRPAKSETFRLLWIGRMESRKGLPLALEAMAKAREVPVRLAIVGDGPQRRSWEGLVRRLDLRTSVEFLGVLTRSQVQKQWAAADGLIFTSLRDAFPSVVIEAMANAVPVIALDHQGVGELMPAEAGIKAPVSTPEVTVEALASAIRDLWSDPARRERMGEAGWRAVREHTWTARAERMSGFYEQCVEAGSAGPRREFLRPR